MEWGVFQGSGQLREPPFLAAVAPDSRTLGMAALGQKRSFVPGEADVRFFDPKRTLQNHPCHSSGCF